MKPKGETHRLYSFLHDHWNYAKQNDHNEWLIWHNNEWQIWTIGSDEFFREI